MGVGYIIGPRIAGVLVAGSVLSWLVLQPLLASLIDPVNIALQQVKLGFLARHYDRRRLWWMESCIRKHSQILQRPFIVHTSGKSVQAP